MKAGKASIIMVTLVAIIAALSLIAYNTITIFVIQPIGALPEGRTIIMRKLENSQFIDSADAMCERRVGNVNLICRAVTLGSVIKNEDDILMKLPYSEFLYLRSTEGVTYSSPSSKK
ncbi:hypothetical protein [Rheinheimera sp. D18]|uniref:hypothetical protein n=1 Tax=Rheinheimera sp. D18 TaxID=2545632 RepID=UPI001A9CC709|nr:hypothetical protein [Rheinheimera sp. D18]